MAVRERNWALFWGFFPSEKKRGFWSFALMSQRARMSLVSWFCPSKTERTKPFFFVVFIACGKRKEGQS